MAGVLALHNISVLDARLESRADGVTLDVFHVADALGSGMVGKARWPAVRSDLSAVLAGDLDLEVGLEAKRRAYRRRGGAVATRVTTRLESGRRVFEVRCSDRVGLLHDLAAVFAEHGFDVEVARVDTRGDRVVDVFYVSGLEGPGPETDVGVVLAELEQAAG
jgi:[protein-PII] uridylyltransferase